MYDLIIIGGGPAGGTAAEEAKKAGFSVLLIEKKHLGGVCLNEGCIPSKFFLCCSKRFYQAKNSAAFGISAENISFDIKKVVDRKNELVGKLRKASESSKKKNSIDVVFAEAFILPKDNDCFRVQAASTVYKGKRLLLCTGSEAIRGQIEGSNLDFVYTNREILDIDFIPKHIVIIGAGIIGLEFATFFAELGASVTVIEKLPTIAGTLETDIASILKKNLEKKGIVFHLESTVTKISNNRVYFTSYNSSRETAAADIILMSIGRRPNIENLGLQNIGVEIENRAVKTDDHGRTNVEGVFAAGDINGKLMLAHTASREAQVCVNTMIGKSDRIRYDTIPSVVYTHPEVAWVGLTEDQARQKGCDVVTAKIPLTYSGRYFVENDTGRDLIKVIADRRDNSIVGIHMIGGECSEIIHGASIIMEAKLGVEEINKIVFPHPTIAEILKDAILQALSTPLL